MGRTLTQMCHIFGVFMSHFSSKHFMARDSKHLPWSMDGTLISGTYLVKRQASLSSSVLSVHLQILPKFEEWILLHLSACHKGLILWPQIFKFCNFCVNNFCYIDIFQPYFWKFFLKIIMIRSYTNSVAIEKQETC